MSWDNPIFPRAAKNSIGFLVPFFLSYPRVVGGSVDGYYRAERRSSFRAALGF